MTLRTFNQLSEAAKHEEIDLWGDLIMEKVTPGYLIHFYKLHNFFVEVYLDPLHRRIQRYRACMHNLYNNTLQSTY